MKTMRKMLKSKIDITAIVGITIWTALMVLFLYMGIEDLKNQTYQLSKHQARAFFEEIITARSWNATHGGVYVPVTSKTKPNPYLKDPDRDVVTEKGLKLTKINPAFMTRQIAEIAGKTNLVWFHITSAKPIRPENAPDKWESKTLSSFLSGSNEFSEFIEDGKGKTIFRYMAPLWVESACLKCHSAQGYKEGDLRGGISVSISATPILATQKKAVRQLSIVYISIWALGIAGILFGYRLIKKEELRRIGIIVELEESIGEVKRLSGLLPICSHCKKIRDDKGYWNQIESYISDHSEAQFSHGICQECSDKLYGEEDWYIEMKSEEKNK